MLKREEAERAEGREEERGKELDTGVEVGRDARCEEGAALAGCEEGRGEGCMERWDATGCFVWREGGRRGERRRERWGERDWTLCCEAEEAW